MLLVALERLDRIQGWSWLSGGRNAHGMARRLEYLRNRMSLGCVNHVNRLENYTDYRSGGRGFRSRFPHQTDR